MRLAVSPDYPPYNSALQNMRHLRNAGILDKKMYSLLERTRHLRNNAIHGPSGASSITTNEAVEYVHLARSIVEKLKNLERG